jgi:hypothetical protein
MTTSLLHARAGLHVMGHSARRALAPNFSTTTVDVNGPQAVAANRPSFAIWFAASMITLLADNGRRRHALKFDSVGLVLDAGGTGG